MIFGLAQDFSVALAAIPAVHPKYRTLELLEEAIRRDIHFINRHPTTMFQCMWNTCWWYDCPEASEYYVVEDNTGTPPWEQDSAKMYLFMETWDVEKSLRYSLCQIRSRRPPQTPLGSPLISTLHGHSSFVDTVVFTPDGRFLISGSRHDSAIRIWDARELYSIYKLSPDNVQQLYACCISPDGQHILGSFESLNYSCVIYMWNVESGDRIGTWQLPEDVRSSVNFLSYSPDGQSILTASDSCDTAIYIWDAHTLKLRNKFDANKRLHVVGFSRDGRSIISICDSPQGGKELIVWDIKTSQRADSIRIILRSVNVELPGGMRGIGIGQWACVALWDLSTGQSICRLPGCDLRPLSPVGCGNQFMCIWHDDLIGIFDPWSGECSRVLAGHTGKVSSVAISPDGSCIASGAWDNTVRVWHSRGLGGEHYLKGHDRDITRLIVTPESTEAASGSTDEAICIWEAASGRLLRRLGNALHGAIDVLPMVDYDGANTPTNVLRHDITALTYSSDGTIVIAGFGDGKVIVWDVLNGAEQYRLNVGQALISSLACSCDGKHIGIASMDGQCSVWKLSTGNLSRLRRGLYLSLRIPLCLLRLFCPEHQKLSTNTNSYTIKLKYQFKGHVGGCTDLSFSCDGLAMATGSVDRKVRVWDLRTGKLRYCLVGHSDGVICITYSPDSRLIASVGGHLDRTLRVWDSHSGGSLYSFQLGPGTGRRIAFSGDSTLVACRSINPPRIERWNLTTGERDEIIEGVGDVSAIACDEARYRWRALSRGGETIFESLATHKVVAWYPESMQEIVMRLNGTRCIGYCGGNLIILDLIVPRDS